jgi:hypothetical protein
MSNIISDVVKLKYNSFILASAMLSYYENCKVRQDNVLLIYLLFPVILNSDWIIKAPIPKKNSRLESWVKDNKIHIEGLPERMTTFQRLSETTLQYCIDMEYVKVDESNNVIVNNNPFKKKSVIDNAAIRLSKLIGDNTPAKIFAALGIRELNVL